jgi:hypothetical protein
VSKGARGVTPTLWQSVTRQRAPVGSRRLHRPYRILTDKHKNVLVAFTEDASAINSSQQDILVLDQHDLGLWALCVNEKLQTFLSHLAR